MDETGRPSPPGEPPIDVFTCPHCQQEVAVDPVEPHPFIICPYCGNEFAVPQPGEVVAEETPDAEATDPREDELNGIRIKQIAAGRRAAIRGISYLWVGVFACVAVVGGLIQKAYQRVSHERRWDLRTFAFIGGAAVTFSLAGYFYRNLRALKREVDKPLLDEPTTPPDFSTLSDGTQQWKNLDDVR